MEHSPETELALLKQHCENLDIQLKRFIAHLESEQRVYGETSRRVGDLNHSIQTMQKLIEKLDNIVINGGNGLLMRVDRIEQRENESKNRLFMWVSIASVLISLASIAIQITVK